MQYSPWIPDSIYSSYPEQQTVCKNVAYSPITRSLVHDSQTGKVFCPFGTDNSMNQSIYADQEVLNQRISTSTPFGRVPQLDPRPLARIGIRWMTT
jgi:hypothetical protein